jgi:chorismate dehydratase
MSDDKVKISAVSYLNTKPFLYGLRHTGLINDIHLSLDVPSVCAAKLISGEAQVGIVPVAAIPQIKDAKVITDYCIGADGTVASVSIYSNVEISFIEKLLLDNQSRTSVKLAELLLKNYWKHIPEFIPAKEGYENTISGTTAGVIIGDRAFSLQNKFNYVYDLADTWKKWTGLPFVFAAWVSRVSLPDSFIQKLNKAFEYGIDHIDVVSKEEQKNYRDYDVQHYLSKNISYPLDSKKREAMKRFLELIK